MYLLLAAAALLAGDAPSVQAYKMLQQHKMAMVSTISREEGDPKPYGSVMAVSLVDKDCSETLAGAPYVFISDLAEHTQNIDVNPNVSIMVFQPDAEGNVFNGKRVTVSGKMILVEDEAQIAKFRKTYLADHPDSADFIDFGDFNFYVLAIESIYFVGGFGDEAYIGTIEPENYHKAAE